MKKTSKRLLSILMAAAMLISLIPQTIFTSSARDNYVECDYCGSCYGCADYICEDCGLCPDCDTVLVSDSQYCPNCGKQILQKALGYQKNTPQGGGNNET